jgi:hypothetical protein
MEYFYLELFFFDVVQCSLNVFVVFGSLRSGSTESSLNVGLGPVA